MFGPINAIPLEEGKSSRIRNHVATIGGFEDFMAYNGGLGEVPLSNSAIAWLAWRVILVHGIRLHFLSHKWLLFDFVHDQKSLEHSTACALAYQIMWRPTWALDFMFKLHVAATSWEFL
jgi:hypothetical protein